MTIIEAAETETPIETTTPIESVEQTDPVERVRPSRAELLLDWPNVTAHIVELNGGRHSAASRVNLNALARFLSACDAENVSGTFFMRIDNGDSMLPLVTAIRRRGFDVFARDGEDIDDDLVAHVREQADSFGSVWIATHDRELLNRCLDEIADDVEVTVLGLAEASSAAIRDDRVGFLDLGEIPGVLSPDLPRTSLETLPPEGRHLPALGRIRSRRNRR